MIPFIMLLDYCMLHLAISARSFMLLLKYCHKKRYILQVLHTHNKPCLVPFEALKRMYPVPSLHPPPKHLHKQSKNNHNDYSRTEN